MIECDCDCGFFDGRSSKVAVRVQTKTKGGVPTATAGERNQARVRTNGDNCSQPVRGCRSAARRYWRTRGNGKKIRRGAKLEWEFRILNDYLPVLFFGGIVFLGMGIDKWPAHSVRFSRRLERVEESKNGKRRGVAEERERGKASKDEKKAKKDAQQRTNGELNWAWTLLGL